MAGNHNSGQHLRNGRPEGAGRAKGQRNTKSILIEDILSTQKYVDLIDNGTFISPVSFWIEILHDLALPFDVRNEAAKNLAKYLHKAQPVQTETNITTSENLNGFTISLLNQKAE